MENSNLNDKNLSDNIYDKKPFLEFHLKRKLNNPLVFKTNIFKDISNSETRQFIIQPKVVESIIGRVLIDYHIDIIKKHNLPEIYKILGYIQFGKIKSLTKFGFLNEYCIFDVNKETIIMVLFSEKIISDYFDYPKENLSKLKVFPIIRDNIEKLCMYREYPNRDILINLDYLKKLYNGKVKNLDEGFSLSQKVCGMIPDP
jgi:hypothetical protein